MATRRRFLSYLGLGAAAGPLAAKATIEQESLRLATQFPGTLAGAVGLNSNAPVASGGNVAWSYEKICEAAVAYFKTTGKVPDYIDARLRIYANHVGYLDPDLISKRSWSFNVKIAEQRRRNYERALEAMENTVNDHIKRGLFERLTGWSWPF